MPEYQLDAKYEFNDIANKAKMVLAFLDLDDLHNPELLISLKDENYPKVNRRMKKDDGWTISDNGLEFDLSKNLTLDALITAIRLCNATDCLIDVTVTGSVTFGNKECIVSLFGVNRDGESVMFLSDGSGKGEAFIKGIEEKMLSAYENIN